MVKHTFNMVERGHDFRTGVTEYFCECCQKVIATQKTKDFMKGKKNYLFNEEFNKECKGVN
jgi:hypothetical protein